MHIFFAAAALSVTLLLSVAGVAAELPAPRGSAGAQGPVTDTVAGGADAAAKHAKRTACLKDAKFKKLLGPDKSAFIKRCIGAP